MGNVLDIRIGDPNLHTASVLWEHSGNTVVFCQSISDGSDYILPPDPLPLVPSAHSLGVKATGRPGEGRYEELDFL